MASKALQMAGVAIHRPALCARPQPVHHSDRGCQHTSADYRSLLEANGITVWMSRRGNALDNAVAESFFAEPVCVATPILLSSPDRNARGGEGRETPRIMPTRSVGSGSQRPPDQALCGRRPA